MKGREIHAMRGGCEVYTKNDEEDGFL